MDKEKVKTTLEKIEELVVDGQKEVLARIGQVETSLRGEMQEVRSEVREIRGEVQGVRGGLEKLDKKLEVVHSSLKKEIESTCGLLDFGIKEVDKKVEGMKAKLDEHMRQPAHASR